MIPGAHAREATEAASSTMALECVRLPSSLRSVRPEVTLGHAEALAPRLGITRVTDITSLDRVGVPVYSSVRPRAAMGSLCVNAGKGLRGIDARVGAYMEAIEYAMAEPGTSDVEISMRTGAGVLDGSRRREAILDFCPRVQRSVDPAAPLACVESEELLAGESTLVPAELVFLPYVGRPGTGPFGSNSNGLASGNSVTEATLHGLLEVVERDVRSFHNVSDHSRLVDPATLPPSVLEQYEAVRTAGLDMCVRHLPNVFEIPCFEALLWDPMATNSLKLASGYGSHLLSELALVRAVTEAFQSRLSWIHGARDDLIEPDSEIGDQVTADVAERATAQWGRYTDRSGAVPYVVAERWSSDVPSLDHALGVTIDRLQRARVKHLCRVRFTPETEAIQVVKVIVPRLEYFDRFSGRVGPRLFEFIRGNRA